MGVTSEQLGPDCQTLLLLLRVYTPVKHNIQIWNYGLIEYLHGPLWSLSSVSVFILLLCILLRRHPQVLH